MRRNRPRWPWAVGAVGLAALVTVVTVVIGTDAETAAVSLSLLVSSAAGLFSWSWHRSRPAVPANRTELDQAAEDWPP